MQIESTNSVITTNSKLPVLKYLGYDYAGLNLYTSCIYEDLAIKNCYNQFYPIKQKFNQYGLIDSLDVMQQYLSIRNQLINKGYDMEELYFPTVVKLSIVSLT